MKMKDRYNLNKDLKVGYDCVCPSCNNHFVKKTHQQVFCKTKNGTICKDKYWNTITPTKRNNKTRISPANARYYNSVILPNEAFKRGFPSVPDMKNYVNEDDGSWDAHSCYVEPCNFCGLKAEFCRCEDF